MALAASGAEDGLWLRAEQQTAGRGRMGRGWESPRGNLYVSHLVRLRSGDPSAATLAFVAAVALEEALRVSAPGIGFEIKWPNDVMAVAAISSSPEAQDHLPPAKISGILLERTGDAVIIGMGVNLAHHPENLDRPVTSLAALGVAAPEPDDFLLSLAHNFATQLECWRGDGLGAIRTKWLARAHPEGTSLTVTEPDGARVEGRFAGLDTDCALQLRLANGAIRAIHAGDVFYGLNG